MESNPEEVPARIPNGSWKIDPMHSSVTFSVRHLMSKMRGRFTEVDGQIVVGQPLASCSVEASIATASVDTGTQMRDDDLRSSNFFDSARFPAMRFASTQIAAAGDDTSIAAMLRRLASAVRTRSPGFQPRAPMCLVCWAGRSLRSLGVAGQKEEVDQQVVKRPKSTVAHHVNVLAGAGLLRVTRTRRVRAIFPRTVTARVSFRPTRRTDSP